MAFDQSLWAAAGAVVGGVLTKILTHHQKNVELKHDDLSQIRKELKERCDRLQAENNHWQLKYYSDMNNIKEELFLLRADNAALKVQLTDLKTRGWVPDDEKERYK